MNIKQLKEIVRIFEQSTLKKLEVREGEEEILLERMTAPVQEVVYSAPMLMPAAEAPVMAAPTAAKAPAPAAEGLDFNRITEVKSPVVGMFYSSPDPASAPFVKVGDQVKKGDVLCLIEVMKQMNEVTAPQDGQVADVCVSNGCIVEYGQTLMKLC